MGVAMSRIVSSLLISGVNPVVVGGTGASVKYFPPPANTSNFKRGHISCPGFNQANGQLLVVEACGNIKSASAFEIGLYGMVNLGTPILMARAAFSPERDTESWFLRADLFGDSDSATLGGKFNIQSLRLLDSPGYIYSLSDINFASEEPYSLVLGVKFSLSDAKNKASMFQFRLLQ